MKNDEEEVRSGPTGVGAAPSTEELRDLMEERRNRRWSLLLVRGGEFGKRGRRLDLFITVGGSVPDRPGLTALGAV